MTRRGNVEKIILDFAKAVCEGERTMIDEKKVELMKKLQRLAERGVGGEKTGSPIPFNGSYIQGCWNVGGKRMSRPTKTCYDCKNACWDSVPYGSTTATMFGGCDKEDEMTEEEAERFGETEDCPFWENRYKEENA